jgi:hypothetical protein
MSRHEVAFAEEIEFGAIARPIVKQTRASINPASSESELPNRLALE